MKSKGFSILELLVVLTIVSLAMGLVYTTITAVRNWEKISLTKKVIKALNDAVEMNFRSNSRFASSNCYGFSDGLCSQITLTPLLLDEHTLQFNTYDANVVSLLRSVGCVVEGNLPNFTVRCYDGFGKLLTFREENEHQFGTPYTAPYKGEFFTLDILDSIGNRYQINLRRVEEFFIDLSKEKLSTVAGAIKDYVSQKRRLELVNICDDNGTSEFDPPGGLSSWDDSEVPWIWQALGSKPFALCEGVENSDTGCGCTNFSNTTIWRTSQDWCVLDSSEEIRTFLRNINLDIFYETDAFGNPIVVVPIADSEGNPLEEACPPPRPQPFYPLAIVTKTRVGVKDENGNWVLYTDVTGQ